MSDRERLNRIYDTGTDGLSRADREFILLMAYRGLAWSEKNLVVRRGSVDE